MFLTDHGDSVSMRSPAVAGRFYPSDPESLLSVLRMCIGREPGPGDAEFPGGRIRGVMVPHAGYLASGYCAAYAYSALSEADSLPDAFVVIGPDHYGTVRDVAMSSEDHLTPLGVCRVHRGIADRLSCLIPDIPEAHRWEHSIEVQLPFIQLLGDCPVIPVIMGDQSPRTAVRLAEALREACEGYDVVFVASTDLSHYVPKAQARREGSMVLEKVESMDPDGLYDVVRGNGITMCGYGPVMTVMRLCEKCTPQVLSHMDSGDTVPGGPDGVVGYASALFREG